MPDRNFCAMLSPMPYNFCRAHSHTRDPKKMLVLTPELLPCVRRLYFLGAHSGSEAGFGVLASEIESENIPSVHRAGAESEPQSESEVSSRVRGHNGLVCHHTERIRGDSKIEQICNFL